MKDSFRVFGLMTIGAVLLAGCATGQGGLTEREAGAVLGAGLGAGTGAIIGHQTGHAGAGTAIGAGAGALAGALVGEAQRRQKQAITREMRQEIAQQRYQAQYGAQPYGVQVQPRQEVHTKYNPRTGQTFPGGYKFDPNTGEELKYLR